MSTRFLRFMDLEKAQNMTEFSNIYPDVWPLKTIAWTFCLSQGCTKVERYSYYNIRNHNFYFGLLCWYIIVANVFGVHVIFWYMYTVCNCQVKVSGIYTVSNIYAFFVLETLYFFSSSYFEMHTKLFSYNTTEYWKLFLPFNCIFEPINQLLFISPSPMPFSVFGNYYSTFYFHKIQFFAPTYKWERAIYLPDLFHWT